ncbi:hypothetical protein ACFQH2_00630 [Natronoarchaeum sp. GCM10025703]|uniref:hypothetical protein n=1 Tax=Natronoarchaeum sp. GCM10025703 TaxID=3252685 RepID=UPI003613A83B
MPTIHLDVSESLAESLDTERELLGFESREAYLRWVVDHRTDIEVGSDREQVLSAFTERVEELKPNSTTPTKPRRSMGTPSRPAPNRRRAGSQSVNPEPRGSRTTR